MKNDYESEEETNALIHPDTRTPEQKKANELADKNWMNEQGVEPQRQWVGLTDAEVATIFTNIHTWHERAQAIEARLRSKNT